MAKNRSKLVAIIGTTIMLSAGGAFTSRADWAQEGNIWVFYDGRGNRVTESWRPSGANQFYLDSNGVMVTNRWVDETYYVNESGARVSDCWIYSERGTPGLPNYDGGWFYLDSNGRAVKNGWRTINNQRYHFDSDGMMQYGWLTEGDSLYYLGGEHDGAAKTGWLCLEDDEYYGQEDGTVAEIVSGGGVWYYFQNNGRAVRASGADAYTARTINGYRYYFDRNGKMVTGWVSIGGRENGDSTGISTMKYFGGPDEGQMARGWRYLYSRPEDSYYVDNFTSNNWGYRDYWDGVWYYFDSNGTPAYLNANAASLTDATTRINGHRYFFDEYGRMQSGLIGLRRPDSTMITAYFGANDSDGALKNNRQTNVFEDNGERSTFYFTNEGGYTGEYRGYLYYQGKMARAEEWEDFQVFELDGRRYLVNEAGRVQSSNNFYRINGEYRYEVADGTVYYVNSNRERIGEVTGSSRIPEIAYRAVFALTGQNN